MSDREKREYEMLIRILQSYQTYFNAAMRATSLGLCKAVIKHAKEDEKRIREEYE